MKSGAFDPEDLRKVPAQEADAELATLLLGVYLRRPMLDGLADSLRAFLSEYERVALDPPTIRCLIDAIDFKRSMGDRTPKP